MAWTLHMPWNLQTKCKKGPHALSSTLKLLSYETPTRPISMAPHCALQTTVVQRLNRLSQKH